MKFFLGLIVFLTLWVPAWALDNPEQTLTNVIESYIDDKCPDWIGLDVKVTYKHADEVLEELRRKVAREEDVKIGELYDNFKPAGNVIFPIETPAGRFFVRAKVEVFQNVVCAKTVIRRGSRIGEEQVALEKRDIALLPTGFFLGCSEVGGLETKTTIPKGSTIFAWMVKKVPLIRRGDAVMILLKGEGILVRARGSALMDGYLNDTIKVKRMGYNKPIEGTVVSTREVEVML